MERRVTAMGMETATARDFRPRLAIALFFALFALASSAAGAAGTAGESPVVRCLSSVEAILLSENYKMGKRIGDLRRWRSEGGGHVEGEEDENVDKTT